MSGVTWTQRQPSDWLASNGRWYAHSKYPKGWSTSALPPAPGHGGVGSILREYAGVAAGIGRDSQVRRPSSTSEQTQGTAAASRTAASPTGSSVARTGRAVADATVASQATYRPRVGPGAPPPPALPSQAKISDPPGRIRDDAPVVPPPPVKKQDEVRVDAGDLGTVLGSAKRRIERAINESYDAQ
ncbi:MAG: hypothetical protein ACI81L_002512 [Verrucomicrobiales bacterium]|jgi:hypothetical protein